VSKTRRVEVSLDLFQWSSWSERPILVHLDWHHGEVAAAASGRAVAVSGGFGTTLPFELS
jgi:hypothetical protein